MGDPEGGGKGREWCGGEGTVEDCRAVAGKAIRTAVSGNGARESPCFLPDGHAIAGMAVPPVSQR
ncbi:hypothetical protein AZSP09_30300 [Azospira sp. I09]|nr:hypothetical protein AZSP09_30300 [Azospira sp. I09]